MGENEFLEIALKQASEIAPKYGADPKLIAQYLLAIAKVESTLRVNARNKSSTARGIMQMLICTQRENEKKRAKIDFAPAMFSCKSYKTTTVSEDKDKVLNDPEYAIMLATYEFCYQYKRYKYDIDKAIHAYNQGSYPGGNMKDGANYTKKVLKNLGEYPNIDYETVTSQKTSSEFQFDNMKVIYRSFY